MKRFFIWLLAFTVSLSGLSVLQSATVNAVSPFDNYIQNATPPYTIKSSNNAVVSEFANVDEVLGYYSVNFETRLSQGVSFCGNSFDNEYFQTKIIDSINNGNPYYISQMNANNIHFLVQTSNTATLTHTWYEDGSGGGYDNYYSTEPSLAAFFITIANNGNRPICGYQTDLQNASSMGYGEIIGSTMPFTTPPDYDGQIPNPIVTATDVYPLVSYTVETDNTVNALNSGVFEDVCINVGNPTSGCAIPNISWYITDENDNVLNSYTNGLKAPYTFKLPGNGTFYLNAKYSLPPPFLNPSPDINLVTTRIQIDANGTWQKGGTGVNECAMVGSSVYECEPADPLEDCSTYGLDLGGYFQCIINNFGIWLRNTLINLFVPSYSFFSSWTTSFGEYLNSKLGFVYTSFAIITSLFTGVITNGATSTCTVSPPGELFGAPFIIDVCDFEQVVGSTVFGILQGLVISLTILALAFAGYRKYIEVVGTR